MEGNKSKMWIIGLVALGSIAVRLLIARQPAFRPYF